MFLGEDTNWTPSDGLSAPMPGATVSGGSNFEKASLTIDVPTTITDHTPACHHTKVYADYILTSNPPQHPWICSICGTKGVDCGTVIQGPSYDELVAKFSGSGAVKLHSYFGGL